MYALSHNQSVVLDRELDQEKSLAPSGPRIRCPLCGWSPRKLKHGVFQLTNFSVIQSPNDLVISSNYGSCTFSLTLGCRLAFLVQNVGGSWVSSSYDFPNCCQFVQH